jgi:RNA polymerase sigma-54 factor
MVLLQPKLHLRLSQRQILTPGLVQMVSVLALNKLELRDMITAEMVENPVLEELEDSVPLLDDAARQEEDRERIKPEENTVTAEEKKDPFEEIDFGSFFQEYLDPGYRSRSEMEEIERPSFENFLSKPTTLSDHLAWQLGALSVSPEVREAAETIIGNLSEDGYLIASDEELLGIAPPAAPEVDASIAESVVKEAAALGLATDLDEAEPALDEADAALSSQWDALDTPEIPSSASADGTAVAPAPEVVAPDPPPAPQPEAAAPKKPVQPLFQPSFKVHDLHEALDLVRQMDPPGVACRDLRDCLLYQLRYHQAQLATHKNGNGEATAQVLTDAVAIVDQHLRALKNKQYKEIARAIGRTPEAVQEALDYIRTLDPRPGLRYNKSQPRLIEPMWHSSNMATSGW